MACECNVATIARECGKNAANAKPTVYVTCEDEVNTIAAAGPPAVPKGYFRTWNAKRKDASFKSTQNEEGGQWETEASYFIPKQSAEKAAILNNLGEDNSILVLTDMNGAKRIVGEIGNPANIAVGEETSPSNGYKITVKWTSGYSPYFLTGAVDTSAS